jgi:hypothetical protein
MFCGRESSTIGSHHYQHQYLEASSAKALDSSVFYNMHVSGRVRTRMAYNGAVVAVLVLEVLLKPLDLRCQQVVLLL